jgi:hypothetical protein
METTSKRNNQKHHSSLITSIKTKTLNITLVNNDICKDVTWPTQYAINALGLEVVLYWCSHTKTWHTQPCKCFDASWNDVMSTHVISIAVQKDMIAINVKDCPKLRTIIQRTQDGKLLLSNVCGKLKHWIVEEADKTYQSKYIDNAIEFKKMLKKALNAHRQEFEDMIVQLNNK